MPCGDCPRGGLLILDGLEQLSRAQRRKLRRVSARNDLRILATSHRELNGFQTIYQMQPQPAVIQQLVESLIERSSYEVKQSVLKQLQACDLTRVKKCARADVRFV